MQKLTGEYLIGAEQTAWQEVLLLHPEAILLTSHNRNFAEQKYRQGMCVRIDQRKDYNGLFGTWSPYDLKKWKGRCRMFEGM